MKNVILTLLLFAIALFSCTDNQRARLYGGKETIKLKPNEIILNITWKSDDMWVLTKDTITGISHFREHSSFGVWEGEVTIE